jgi:hypothetical protein
MSQLSRRAWLLRFAALAGSTIAGRLLVACRPAPEPAATPLPPTEPTAPPPSMPTIPPPPTSTVAPTLAPPPPRPEIIRFHPDGPSTVVQARHNGVWQDGKLVPEALRRLLDASITALTGLADARSAWAALFRPHERVAIKVNAFQNSLVWTHHPLVTALTDCLKEAGVPPAQIVIYDRQSSELQNAGFAVNYSDPGVRCRGNDGRYTRGWSIADVPIGVSRVLLECDALINMPVLKTHGDGGISFALKNHYGTVDPLPLLHGTKFDPAITQLNALAPIIGRSRLIIGDVLGICLHEERSWPFWREEVPGDTILVSYDPVAVDTVALRLFAEALKAGGGDPTWNQGKAGSWLKLAAELGVGTNDETNMAVKELALG